MIYSNWVEEELNAPCGNNETFVMTLNPDLKNEIVRQSTKTDWIITTVSLLFGLTTFMFKHAATLVITLFTTGSTASQERRTSKSTNP